MLIDMIDLNDDDVEQRFLSRNPVQLAQAAAIQYPFDPFMMFAALRTSMSVYTDVFSGTWKFEADKGKVWRDIPCKELAEVIFKDKRFIRYPFQNLPVYSMNTDVPESTVTVAFQANKGTSVMSVLVAVCPTEVTVIYISTQDFDIEEAIKELGTYLTSHLK